MSRLLGYLTDQFVVVHFAICSTADIPGGDYLRRNTASAAALLLLSTWGAYCCAHLLLILLSLLLYRCSRTWSCCFLLGLLCHGCWDLCWVRATATAAAGWLTNAATARAGNSSRFRPLQHANLPDRLLRGLKGANVPRRLVTADLAINFARRANVSTLGCCSWLMNAA